MALNLPQRKILRLKKYDYSDPGYYFVTICTKKRQEFFGRIANRLMMLNQYGEMVKNCWLEIPAHFPNVYLDEFIIMPNHLHGIIVIKPKFSVGHRHACALQNEHACALQNKNEIRRQDQLLPLIINLFKSSSSRLIHLSGLNSFCWQKSYYEHIIRNEKSLEKIRDYIRYNHLKWDEDIENPKNKLQTDYYEKLF